MGLSDAIGTVAVEKYPGDLEMHDASEKASAANAKSAMVFRMMTILSGAFAPRTKGASTMKAVLVQSY